MKRLREQMGTAGLAVAIVALIAALCGGAYAASNSGSGPKASASAKAKRGPRGPKGPKGDPGAKGDTGAAGKDGAQGPQGNPGSPGKDGESGSAGNPGKDVVVTPIATGIGTCAGQGGIKVEVKEEPASAKNICNGQSGPPGADGAQGPEGKPWTPNSELPVGATETGSWSFNATDADGEIQVPISFPIKLPAPAPDSSRVHYETETNFTDFDEGNPETIGCEGTPAVPRAPSGHLCVYGSEPNFVTNAEFKGIFNLGNSAVGANRVGALLNFEVPSGIGRGAGSFAVTG